VADSGNAGRLSVAALLDLADLPQAEEIEPLGALAKQQVVR